MKKNVATCTLYRVVCIISLLALMRFNNIQSMQVWPDEEPQWVLADEEVDRDRVNMNWTTGSWVERSERNPYIKTIDEILVENFERQCVECPQTCIERCNNFTMQIMSLVLWCGGLCS